jgi:ABC-type glutathione transport system ATPase component
VGGEDGDDRGRDSKPEAGGQLESRQGPAECLVRSGGRHQGGEAARVDDLTERAQHRNAHECGRGYDHGAELSGGQWQTIGLARSLMRRSPMLLVLDEPAAALDASAEQSGTPRRPAAPGSSMAA